MANPFPGMDPYLEDPAYWPDFHHRFIDCWCEAVADLLPESYEARLDERVNLEEGRETHIDILHRPDRSLVAVLEMLSPANKTGDGFQEYRAKRKAILVQKVHLMELDLLFGGNRLPLIRPLPAGDHFAFVSRLAPTTAQTVRFIPGQSGTPLPTIPIPLKAPDTDVHVDLETVFQATYERGRYGRSLRYGQPPLAPLSEEDARWAVALSARK
ncbi:MAG TPA: DUF4058 family protein [Gemmataceae bacterium]|jgi:hypothetical protein|nr:DUF4058 family protein [Gemmataceae bacterium]